MSDSASPVSPENAVPPTLQPAPPRRPAETLKPPTVTRIWCGVMFLLCAAMMSIGLYMAPDPFHDGLGTHRQLGFPPCGSIVYFGIPCPTCGCTTAVTYVAHGNIVAAFVTQPFGALVGLLGIAGVLLGGAGLVTGKWYGPDLRRLNAHSTALLIVSLTIVIVAWVYKIWAYKHGIHW